MTPDEAWKILESADRLCEEATVRREIARIAVEITVKLKDRYPFVLAVMGGSIFFAGHLLPQLRFPIEFDTIQLSRYGKANSLGAAAFYSAVLTDKNIGRDKPIVPDFVGLKLPNRYVFGCGMDVSGAWRNLPEIYAVKDS